MFELVMQAADYYEAEYEKGRAEIGAHPGAEIVRLEAKMAGMIADRYAQLQDMESILEHLETKENRAKVDRILHYTEHYGRKLTDTVAAKYADVHDDVQLFRMHRQYLANKRNLFLGLIKGLETLHYQLGNITKLHASGLENVTL